MVDADDYVCEVDYRTAQSELTGLDLQVSVERFATPNDGSCPEDSVAELSPVGHAQQGRLHRRLLLGPGRADRAHDADRADRAARRRPSRPSRPTRPRPSRPIRSATWEPTDEHPTQRRQRRQRRLLRARGRRPLRARRAARPWRHGGGPQGHRHPARPGRRGQAPAHRTSRATPPSRLGSAARRSPPPRSTTPPSCRSTTPARSAPSSPTAATRSVPYIVMEYVAGRTLRDILREGRKILPERALEITSGVLSAPRLQPPRGDHPPRHQARQRDAHAVGRREGDGLRHRPRDERRRSPR